MPSTEAAQLDAVTIDAFGTLVELESPVGRLRAALADRGVEREAEDVAGAFAAEVEYYLVHKGEGRDADTLGDLRARCAGVFLAGVAPELDAEEFGPAFVGALVFRPMDGVVPALARLRRAGRGLACVSDWGAGGGGRLGRAGLPQDLSAGARSPGTAAAKPDPPV